MANLETLVPWIGLGIVGALFALVLFHDSNKGRRIDEAFARAAKDLGLDFAAEGQPAIRGQVRGFPVNVTCGAPPARTQARRERRALISFARSPRPGAATPRIVIDGRGRIDERLLLRAETAMDSLRAPSRAADLLCGDRGFDDALRIEGDETAALAALDAEARASLLELVTSEGVRVEDGSVVCETRDSLADGRRLGDLVSRMARAAEKLSVPQDGCAAALARNATTDLCVGVRLRNLEVLTTHFPGDPHAELAVRKALEDPDPPVRLRAAAFAGGAPALEALLTVVGDTSLLPEHRVEALRLALGGHAKDATRALAAALADDSDLHRLVRDHPTAPHITAALTSGTDALKEEALAAVHRPRDASLLPRVCEIAAEGSPAVSRAAALALGRLADPEAEPTLVKLLRSPFNEARVAAAGALGRAGTIRSVQALLPIADNALESGEIKSAARDAIRRIQERLGDVAAGRVSLAPLSEPAGGLSLAAERGALSVSPEPPGSDEGRARAPDKVRSH